VLKNCVLKIIALRDNPTFDSFFGLLGSALTYTTHLSPLGVSQQVTDLFDNYNPVFNDKYVTHFLGQKAEEILLQDLSHPHFVLLSRVFRRSKKI